MSDNKKYNKNSGHPQTSQGLSTAVKGTIAILLTILVVIIVIMIFAKTLFIGNNNSEAKKTGVMTAPTEYVKPETSAKTKASSDENVDSEDTDDDDFYNGSDSSSSEKSVEITCTSAVYLHPEPNSSSANLATIPSGAKVKYYKNENGWYYVEYNGQKGYAWQTFFTTPPAA